MSVVSHMIGNKPLMSITTDAVRTAESSAIQRQSLASAVADKLRQKIIRGELHEGEQLRQDAIAAEFQVSRIPVREALRHLQAEGLITIVANRGAVVSALSPEEIGELFDIRAVLECHVLREAIPNFTDEDFRKAEEILKGYEQVVEQDTDISSWGQWNWQFHSTLYAPANRPVLINLLRTLNNNSDRYTRLHLVFTRDLHRAGRAHRILLNACKTRQPDVACEALWHHIIEAGQYLQDFIKSRREKS
ncbi:MAG TPA: GntR family transcriptional regulator [Clostridia bacterium]|nr:GntR family transcriptional regulator [Clostridia bacterium]